MSNIERYEPASMGVLQLSDSQWDRFKTSMAMLVNGGGDFLPDGMKGLQQAQAAALVCLGMGVDPIMAIGGKKVWVVKGRVSFHYNLVLGLCTQRLPGFRYEILEHTDEKCVARFQRSGDHPWHTVSYSVQDAARAGLIKDDGNWKKSPRDMTLSKVIHRGCNAVAADVLMGLPPMVEDDMASDGEPSEGVRTDSIAAVVDGLGAEIMGGGEEVTAPAPPAPAPADSESAKTVFIASAERAGFGTAGKTIKALLIDLLTEEGVAPVLNYAAAIPAQEWRKATLRLSQRYPNGRPPEWPRVKSSDPAPEPAIPVADVVNDSPPVEEPPSAVEDVIEAGEQVLNDQLAEPDYLRDLCIEAQRVTGAVILKGDWFVHASILKSCGLVDDNGAAAPRTLGAHPKLQLTRDQVRALSVEVQNVLDTFRNRGAQVVPRRAENT